MKMINKRKMNVAIVSTFVMILLLACNLNFVGGSLVSEMKENDALPDFLERFLDSYGTNLSKSELNTIRTKWIEQLKHNKEVIAKGDHVFNSSGSRSSAYLESVEITSPYEDYGYIQYASNMEGYYDGNYAHLHTDGWDETYTNESMGGEAFAAGNMSASAGGNVYVYAKKGTHTGSDPPWKNIVMVYASNNLYAGFLNWEFIGWTTVRNGYPAYVFVGNTETLYDFYSVMCWTPPPYPDPYTYPDYFQCILIDSLYATET